MIIIDEVKQEFEKVNIKFTFNGDLIKDCSGEIELTPKEFKASCSDMDRLVKYVFESELHYLINGHKSFKELVKEEFEKLDK